MKETDPKTSKHHGSGKRPNRIEVILNDEENSRLEELSAAAGVKPTQLVRKLIMGGGTVKAALTAEERKLITDLGKMGTNIWKTRNTLIALINEEEGNKQRIPDLQKTIDELKTLYEEFADIKEHFKEKLQK